MTKTEQHRQTLEYFDGFAEEWRKSAEGRGGKSTLIIEQRHAVVKRAIEREGDISTLVDLGCGTGDLVCEVAQLGIRAMGIDFSPNMVTLCDQKRDAAGLGDRAKFICTSVLEFQLPENSVDMVSAMGLIEYISRDELRVLLTSCRSWLRPGGILVLASRNRLFNMRSLNAFTAAEIALGAAPALLDESILLSNAQTEAEVFAALRSLSSLPTLEEHPQTTGVAVVTRHQFTPGELLRIVEACGFEAYSIAPVHYHAFPVEATDRLRNDHEKIARLVDIVAGDDLRLLPGASTFVASYRKSV